MDLQLALQLIALEIETREGDIIITTIYMPPQTKTWDQDKYKELVKNTIKYIRTLFQHTEEKSYRIILNRDCNIHVNWGIKGAKRTENILNNKLMYRINSI